MSNVTASGAKGEINSWNCFFFVRPSNSTRHAWGIEELLSFSWRRRGTWDSGWLVSNLNGKEDME